MVTESHRSRTHVGSALMRMLTHPVTLFLGSILSILLWMPYGFGYYEFPWEIWSAQGTLQIIAIGFPVAASCSYKNAMSERSTGRIVISLLAFMIGVYGCLQMTFWTLYVVWRIDPTLYD
jgi:cellobiose-specific phosphotransferase system component IIC